MKRFFIRLWNWITSPFRKQTKVENKELTPEEVFFKKLKESGFFDGKPTETDEAKLEDLKLSAEKLNHYKRVRASVITLVPKDDGIKNAEDLEKLKDNMRLSKQGMDADKKNT